MSKTKIDIEHIAKLASLKVTPEENITYEKQLEDVLEYVSKLNEVDTENVEPIANITGLQNIGREDIAEPSLTQEEAISQAPKTHNGFIEVEAILENQDN